MDRKRVILAASGLALALVVLAWVARGALSEPTIDIKVAPGERARTEDAPEPHPTP